MLLACAYDTQYINLPCIGNYLTIIQPIRRFFLPLFSDFTQGIDTEKIALLNAASHEMEQAFKVISHYATMLEEKESAFEATVDGKYEFDDVSEMGNNLKFVSNAFHLIINRHPILMLNPSQATDAAKVSIELLDMLEPYMERRNLDLYFEQEAEQALLELDEMVVRHVLWAVYSLSIRYAANGAKLHVSIKRNGSGELEISASMDAIEREMLPRPRQDFYPCVAAHKQNLAARLLPVLSNHINLRIARYFLKRCNGKIIIQSQQKNSIRMIAVFS